MACNRKNQATLTAAEKARYVAAVLAIKASGVYDQFVSDHVNFMAGAHRGPAFLPWHRQYLLDFEAALRKVDSGVSLPYWDWSVDSSPVSSIWNADFMGGNGRPSDGKVMTGPFAFDSGNWNLLDAAFPPFLRRRFGVGVPTLPTPTDVSTALGVTPYDVAPWNRFSAGAFRNTLEGWIAGPQLHNRVHVWVGGSMEPMSSPNDPVFFLHHCFVDKLWADWQTLHPGVAYVPVTGAAAGNNLNDSMEPWASRGVTVTPASVLDHRALGYGYDTDPECTKRIIKEIKDGKEGKREKFEIKELKERKLEKREAKEIRPEKIRIREKPFREKDLIEQIERPGEVVINPAVEDRIQGLEGQVEELKHFIVGELRPDLGLGALAGEPDLAALEETQEDQRNLVRMEKFNKDLEKLREQPADQPHGNQGTPGHQHDKGTQGHHDH